MDEIRSLLKTIRGVGPNKPVTQLQLSEIIRALHRERMNLYDEYYTGGVKPIATGINSVVLGEGAKSTSYREMLVGSFPEELTATPDEWVATDRLFGIGNGIDADNRHDAFRIYKSGYAQLNNALRIGAYSWGTNNPEAGALQYTAGGSFALYRNTTWNRLAFIDPFATNNQFAYFDSLTETLKTRAIAIADVTGLQTELDGKSPASGSGNYIWNQNSVAQNANMWINSGRFGDYGIDIGGDFGTKYGAISIRKNLTGTFANGYHGFEDNSAISITGGLIAYAAFSATPVIVNDLSYDHLVGMQSQPTISSSASVDRLDGFASGINLGSGGASVNNLAGLHVFDYSGTATVANNYGILLENIDNGTNNYSIYAKSGKMYLGADDIELFYGNLQISGRNKYLFLPTCQGKIGDSEGIFTGGSAFNLGISGYSGGGIDIGTGVTKHIELTNSGETFILNGNVHISAAAKYFMQESSQSKFGDASGIFTGGSGIDTGISAYSGGNLILGTGVTPHVILANSGLLKINSLSGTDRRLATALADGTLANISNAAGYLSNDGSGNMSFGAITGFLPTTGGELTGGLIGTTANFSGAATAASFVLGSTGWSIEVVADKFTIKRNGIALKTLDPSGNNKVLGDSYRGGL